MIENMPTLATTPSMVSDICSDMAMPKKIPAKIHDATLLSLCRYCRCQVLRMVLFIKLHPSRTAGGLALDNRGVEVPAVGRKVLRYVSPLSSSSLSMAKSKVVLIMSSSAVTAGVPACSGSVNRMAFRKSGKFIKTADSPRRMIKTFVIICWISARGWCSVMITGIRLLTPFNNSINFMLEAVSSPLVGSSSIMTRGRRASSAQTVAMRRWPWDRLPMS
mmetsp:Transcript_101027/g.324424  ORF Transcript_101027/g.324424 Transcript_101027/m.324424 type:complete len:219 (+) Transcript_101027:873-1529(+)